MCQPRPALRRSQVVARGGYPLLGTPQCNDAFDPVIANVSRPLHRRRHNRSVMPPLSTPLGRVMVLNIRRCVDGFVQATVWAGLPTNPALPRHTLPRPAKPAGRLVP
jgi:hypothetical protein